MNDDIDYKPRWNEKEIPDLLSHAEFVLGIEIPLAKEIRTTINYLQACRLCQRGERDKMFLVSEIKTEIKYKIRFLPSRYSERTEEIAIPEDVLMCAHNGVHRILDNKCDYLAKRCDYRKKECNPSNP
jgi:hypothetical protein